MSGLGPRRPMLMPGDVLFFAADNITPPEAKTIDALGLERISLAEVKRDPRACASRGVEWPARFDRLLVHVDVDVLAFTDFPIAENTWRCDGLSFEDLSVVPEVLLAAPNRRCLTVTEVNPDHAPDEDATFRHLARMLARVL